MEKTNVFTAVLLLIYAVALIATLIGCCIKTVDSFIVMCAIYNTLVGAWVIYSVARYMKANDGE